MTGRWVRAFNRPGPRALVAFPHAGSPAAYFRPWAAELPSLAAVQYPAWQQGPAGGSTSDDLIEGVAGELAARDHELIVLFGHSMGAFVAYEVARRLTAAGLGDRLDLVVSGAVAPHLRVPDDVHTRDDDGLVAELRRLGGTGEDLLSDPELSAAYLPRIREDFRLLAAYRPPDPLPLACPVLAVTGSADPEAPLAGVRAWRPRTSGAFRLRVLPGGHFYFDPDRSVLTGLLAGRLSRPRGWAALPTSP